MGILILASELLRLPVAALDVNARVGKVHDVLIDIETGKFEGITVSPDWLSKPKFVSSQDIVSVDPQGVVISAAEHIVDIKEVVRAKHIWERKIKLIGLKVITQSGKGLGRVNDLVISLQTDKVVRLYVGSFLQDKVISWAKVVKIDKKAVVVDDDVEMVKAGTAVEMEGA